MPSPLDFNSSKNGKNIPDSKQGFRDFLLAKTLKRANGPQTFTERNYQYQTQSELPNIALGGVGVSTGNSLNQASTLNTYKPQKWFIKENLQTLPRRANLGLYPYFVSGDYSLFSIVNQSKFDTESQLFKFAANFIKNDTQGPVYSRIAQNVNKNTLGRVRILDALNGNTNTAINILTGKEPLVESNYNITVDNNLSLPSLATNFLQTTTGVEFPFSIIPGDVLTNPQNYSNNVRPTPKTELGKLYQDTTGALGSLIGIQRRPTNTKKPSDVLVEYMGQGQRNRLFDLLSYSKYAPNYTTTARSQNTSKLFTFADRIAQGGKSLLGIEAPRGIAYIGDDRGNDVYHAMNDFYDRPVRSGYYLSLMFDEVAAKLFYSPKTTKGISEGGAITGPMTWVSSNSKNKPGVNNDYYSSVANDFQDSLSLKYGFRQDSILGKTQEILNSMPSNGGEARSHVANVIDQTSRFFKDGDVKISRGNAVQYVSKFNKSDSGVEYGRVWTKDRAYYSLADTMPLNDVEPNTKFYKGGKTPFRRTNIRRYDGSVLDNTWNINIGPMSDGKKSFESSTNIKERNQGQGDFYAKKYMFSIENLAWKTSNKSGYTVNDLPACERGNNGGRVMWFPPYDLKVNESNSAFWEENKFIGRPEPIYTYSNSQRNATISFKVVVDHPSVLNLLVREHFGKMSDEEADNYINAFFAGIKDIDFYSLIQTYATLDRNDVSLIEAYLNEKQPSETITAIQWMQAPPVVDNKNNTNTSNENDETVNPAFDGNFLFLNASPGDTSNYNTKISLEDVYSEFMDTTGDTINNCRTALTTLSTSTGSTYNNDKELAFGIKTGITQQIIDLKISDIATKVTKYAEDYAAYTGYTKQIKDDLGKNLVTDISLSVTASASAPNKNKPNFELSVRRVKSTLTFLLKNLSKNGDYVYDFDKNNISYFDAAWSSQAKKINFGPDAIKIPLKKLGYTDNNGFVNIGISTLGENSVDSGYMNGLNCTKEYSNPNSSLRHDLSLYAPNSIYCRRAYVNLSYKRKKVVSDTPITGGNSPLIPTEITTTINNPVPAKPNIDVMKRVIMKTLSECHYFKKLEETSPVVFKSLKEKLKYFHPGFHSTTPEGLNSRLTFMLQCLRPGDTIPIRGINEATDLNARNTTFGPPPVCVLRIGDFYHTKMVIKDVNIDYNDGVWDMNPEGIGLQPMIANVTLQVSLIGGQGLEHPVDKLQNALSSNFFANTEMYDERSISTVSTIGGKDAKQFTKEFLEGIQKTPQYKALVNPPAPPQPAQGVYLGTTTNLKYNTSTRKDDFSLEYTSLVESVFTILKTHTDAYSKAFSEVFLKYGPIMSSIFLSPTYRSVKAYEVQTTNIFTQLIRLFGEYPDTFDLIDSIHGFKAATLAQLQANSVTALLRINSKLGNAQTYADELLSKSIYDHVAGRIDAMEEVNDKSLKTLSNARNKVIEVLDKLNFIVKYNYPSQSVGRDVQIVGTTYTQAEFTGFTASEFVAEYIEPLASQKPDYSFFDNLLSPEVIDFASASPTVSLAILKVTVPILLTDYDVNNFDKIFTDKAIFTDAILKSMKDGFTEFIAKPATLKLLKNPEINRTSTKKLIYGVVTTQNVVEDIPTIKSDIEKTLSPTNPLGTTLNLYNHNEK